MKTKKAKKLTSVVLRETPALAPKLYRGEVVRDNSGKLIESFLEKPKQFVAEAITGGIMAGNSGLMESAGRILQGVAKGQFKLQFAKELSELIEKGKIKKDFAEKLYGFQAFTELFEMIDSGDLKEKEKFEALKKLFFLLGTAENPGQEAVVYRLFKIAQNLTSSQLALLNACYKAAPNNKARNTMAYTDWRRDVLHYLGHDIPDFVDADEAELVKLKLLTGREHSDASGVQQMNWRLTDSGLRLCEMLGSDLS